MPYNLSVGLKVSPVTFHSSEIHSILSSELQICYFQLQVNNGFKFILEHLSKYTRATVLFNFSVIFIFPNLHIHSYHNSSLPLNSFGLSLCFPIQMKMSSSSISNSSKLPFFKFSLIFKLSLSKGLRLWNQCNGVYMRKVNSSISQNHNYQNFFFNLLRKFQNVLQYLLWISNSCESN